MKGRVCLRQTWVGCRRREREGKKEWDLASHFVDRLNKSIRAHWSTLIELHKWDREGGHTWQSCYKAATGVGRPQLQALSEINHPCCPLPAFLLCPSLLLILTAVLSIPLFLSPPHISIKRCNFHKAVPLYLHLFVTYQSFSYFSPWSEKYIF